MSDFRFTENEIEQERQWEKRQEFLDERNLTEGDVMEDDFGREFVYDIDHETGIKTKVYIENEKGN